MRFWHSPGVVLLCCSPVKQVLHNPQSTIWEKQEHYQEVCLHSLLEGEQMCLPLASRSQHHPCWPYCSLIRLHQSTSFNKSIPCLALPMCRTQSQRLAAGPDGFVACQHFTLLICLNLVDAGCTFQVARFVSVSTEITLPSTSSWHSVIFLCWKCVCGASLCGG